MGDNRFQLCRLAPITWVRGSLPTSLSPRSLVRFRPSFGRPLTGVPDVGRPETFRIRPQVLMSTASRDLEMSLATRWGIVAGMDEVGRGALAGPVAVGSPRSGGRSARPRRTHRLQGTHPAPSRRSRRAYSVLGPRLCRRIRLASGDRPVGDHCRAAPCWAPSPRRRREPSGEAGCREEEEEGCREELDVKLHRGGV